MLYVTEMVLLPRLLILLPLWLLISANKKFTMSSWKMTNRKGDHQSTAAMEDYEKFLSTFVSGNTILSAIVVPFSKGLKDSSWCYPPYDCFQVGGPFISIYHPISLPPCPPDDIKIELYTRKNTETPFVFDPNDLSKIGQSHFNMNSDTKFLVGGFNAGDGSIFKLGMTPSLLAHSDFNVFHVNWDKASWATYEQTVANARMVGLLTGHFIELLKNETGYPYSKIHLIGHSLGSHICGYAGERLSGKVGRISGLDPAGPYFELSDPRVRLDISDALFVDIIHTDIGFILAAAVGIMQKIGHIDFYPNGGSQQPGCSVLDKMSPAASMTDIIGHAIATSSHARAISLFIESIDNSIDGTCRFMSYACSDYIKFQWGNCRTCGSNGEKCAEMGFNADKYAAAGHPLPAPDKFYLTTNGASPYCKN